MQLLNIFQFVCEQNVDGSKVTNDNMVSKATQAKGDHITGEADDVCLCRATHI